MLTKVAFVLSLLAGSVTALGYDWFFAVNRGDRSISSGVVTGEAGNTTVLTDVGQVPYDIAMRPDGRKLYVSDPVGRSLAILDRSDGRLTLESRLSLEGVPGRMELHPDGTRLFVLNGDYRNNGVWVINTFTGGLLATIPFRDPEDWPSDLVSSPDGRYLYVSQYTGYLTIIDTQTHTVINNVELPPGPRDDNHGTAVAIHPGGTRVYIGQPFMGRILVFDVTNPADIIYDEIAMDQLMPGPMFYNHSPVSLAVRPDGAELWSANHDGTLSIINIAQRAEIDYVYADFGPAPHLGRLVFDRNSNLAILCLPGENKIKMYRPADHQWQRTVDTNLSEPMALVTAGALPQPACLAGTVNARSGMPAAVLTVNGEVGWPSDPVVAPIGANVTVTLGTAPAGPSPASHLLLVWRGIRAENYPVSLNGSSLGCLVGRLPGPIHRAGSPFLCLRGGNIPDSWCSSTRMMPSPGPAPFTVTRTGGFTGSVSVTLQAIIDDAASTSSTGCSITNAVYLTPR